MVPTCWFAIGTSVARPTFSHGIATFTGGSASVATAYRILLADRTNQSGTLNIGTQAGGAAVVTSANTTGVTLLNTADALSATVNLNSGTLVLGGPIYRVGTNVASTATVNLRFEEVRLRLAKVSSPARRYEAWTCSDFASFCR
jgi:hypothetical protein